MCRRLSALPVAPSSRGVRSGSVVHREGNPRHCHALTFELIAREEHRTPTAHQGERQLVITALNSLVFALI